MRKQAEEALLNAQQADKAKAADLRTAYQQHQDEVHRIKRDCEKDIRRLVRLKNTPLTMYSVFYLKLMVLLVFSKN